MATTKTTKTVAFQSQFNSTLLALVVSFLVGQSSKETWQNALTKAATNLEKFPSRIVDGRLIVPSASGANVYAANRTTCQCDAFEKNGRNVGCWHRAAFVVVSRYNEVTQVLGNNI